MIPSSLELTFMTIASVLMLLGSSLIALAFYNYRKAKKLLDKSDEKNRARINFLAHISHELRSPLGAILGFSQLMQKRELSDFEFNRFHSIIMKNGDQLTRIIDDLLDIAKIDAQRLKVELLPVTVVDFISEVDSALQPLAREKGLELRFINSTPLPSVIQSDPIRLKQILLNIVGNALKFTEHGFVEVNIELAPTSEASSTSKLIFQVRDSGIGIDLDAQKKLFQFFEQADCSRKYRGTGLGLALSQRLSELLGGYLVLTESSPGNGSVFTFAVNTGSFDKVDMIYSLNNIGEKVITFCPISPVNSTQLKDTSILIIEDSVDQQILLKNYLGSTGAKLDFADDGRTGLQKILHNNYDIIMTDIQMPHIDGISLTKKLRKSGFKKPILILTAHALENEINKCLEAGCDEHLIKPIRQEVLIEKLKLYVKKPRSQSADIARTSL